MVRVSSPNLLNRPNILSLSRHLAGRLRFHRRTPNITMTLPRHHHYHRISLYFPILLRHPSSHHGPWALALRGTHVSPSLYLFAKIPLLQTSSWRRRFPSLEAQVHRHPQQYRMHNTPHTPRGCFIYPCEWLMNHHGNGRLTLCLSTHTIRYTCILFSKMHLAIQLRLLSERISASSPLPLRFYLVLSVTGHASKYQISFRFTCGSAQYSKLLMVGHLEGPIRFCIFRILGGLVLHRSDLPAWIRSDDKMEGWSSSRGSADTSRYWTCPWLLMSTTSCLKVNAHVGYFNPISIAVIIYQSRFLFFQNNLMGL